MSYSFMSNINVNDEQTFSSPDNSYQSVGVYNNSSEETPENGVIIFDDENNIKRKAKFLMIRAENEKSFIIQLFPSNYCVYVPAGELWSVDSIEQIEKLYIRKIFSTGGAEETSGKLQWMIGYK